MTKNSRLLVLIKDPELLNISSKSEVYTERLVEFHNGEPDYYLKRGHESY